MLLKNKGLYSVFDQLIEENKVQLTESVRNITKIRSVAGVPDDDRPFGPGPADALRAALDIGSEMGFYTKNLDNYAGFVEYGKGEDYIAVLGHLDTVPEGEHWTFPPFSGSIHEGRIYGRGVLDDIGPILSALYGLKAIRDSGVTLTRRIRVIFGTDEETGDLDIAHYLLTEQPPVCGFTPDAEFPVVFAEKGILRVDLARKFSTDFRDSDNNVLVSLNGGEAVNMVPDRAAAEIRTRDPLGLIRKCEEFFRTSGFSISSEQSGEIVTIRSVGVAAHASKPDKGQNAVMQLIAFLSTLQCEPASARDMIGFLQKRIGMETTGVLFGLGFYDEPSGHLTLNVGKVRYAGGDFVLSVDIRYPVTKTLDNLMEQIYETVKGDGFQIIERNHRPPLYYPPESDLIRTLSAIYQDVTGDSGGPIAIGGGTYARRLPNIVAFGPYFPGKANNIHAADESIGCDELVLITKIYARAMYTLAA